MWSCPCFCQHCVQRCKVIAGKYLNRATCPSTQSWTKRSREQRGYFTWSLSHPLQDPRFPPGQSQSASTMLVQNAVPVAVFTSTPQVRTPLVAVCKPRWRWFIPFSVHLFKYYHCSYRMHLVESIVRCSKILIDPKHPIKTRVSRVSGGFQTEVMCFFLGRGKTYPPQKKIPAKPWISLCLRF